MAATSATPQTFRPLPESTSYLGRFAASLRNPIALYTEEFFRNRIYAAPFTGKRFAQVMAPDLAQEVLQSGAVARSFLTMNSLGPVLGEGLLTTDGEKWRRQRRAASPAFRAKALAALVPTFAAAGNDLATRLTHHSGDVVDVQPEMIRATFDVIAATLLASRDASLSQEEISDDIEAFLTTIGRVTLYDFFPVLDRIAPRSLLSADHRRGMAAAKRLREMAIQVVSTRRKEVGQDNDLLGLLIEAEDGETGSRLRDAELVDNTLTFIGAGHETTALALTWTLYCLSLMPELQNDLAEEAHAVLGDRAPAPDDLDNLSLHERVVKESMRLYPPVAIIPRNVIAPLKLDHVSLKAGDHVAVAVYPMHRHQSLWQDPERFDPDRFLPDREAVHHRYQWLPFGGGPRICIGLRFAMMEAVTILACLTRKITAAPGPARDIVPQVAVTMRPQGGMPLKISRR